MTVDIGNQEDLTDTGKFKSEVLRRLNEAIEAAKEAHNDAHAAKVELDEIKKEVSNNILKNFIKAARNAASKFVGDIDTHVLKD